MLRLLCWAHELEAENTELRADGLRRRSLLWQKDFVIQRYHQHRLLCEQLLRDQRQLIEGEPARPGPGKRGGVGRRACSGKTTAPSGPAPLTGHSPGGTGK